MTVDDLKKIHKLSFGNKTSVLKSKKCGCFYCNRIFDSSEIKQWIMDVPQNTAQCPYCLIDSVLCDCDVELSKNLLAEMKLYCFGD